MSALCTICKTYPCMPTHGELLKRRHELHEIIGVHDQSSVLAADVARFLARARLADAAIGAGFPARARSADADVVDLEDLVGAPQVKRGLELRRLAVREKIRAKELPDVRACGCKMCAKGCSRIAGEYAPEQLLFRIADGAKTKEVFADLIIDYYCGEQDNKPYLRPRNVEEIGEPRAIAKLFPIGACVHLGPSGCKLSRTEMPLGCLTSRHDRENPTGKKDADAIWGGAVGRATILLYEIYQLRQKASAADLDLSNGARALEMAAAPLDTLLGMWDVALG